MIRSDRQRLNAERLLSSFVSQGLSQATASTQSTTHTFGKTSLWRWRMPTRSRTLQSAILLGAVAFILAHSVPTKADELQALYVPFVYVWYDEALLPDGTATYSAWQSSLAIFNNSDSPATFSQTAIYGRGAVLSHRPVCEDTDTIPPHTGHSIGGCVAPVPDRGVGFLELQTSPGAVVRADVMRVKFHCSCYSSLGCTDAAQGQVRMPAYRSLFPSGSTVVSGPVELGNFVLPETCFSSNQQYRRRVNVTLLNAGDLPATFTITVLPVHFSSAPISQQSVVVPAKDVIQVNRIPVPTEESTLLAFLYGFRIWITITADQPFLSYVSTVFDNPEPGALPFDVYPSYIEN